ncbi:hypothetical protein QPX48_05335, partial [Corynebacterium accolens]|nr:hypothetical protein [Corynebacterium accolens]
MAQSTGEFAPLRPARELDLEGLTSQQQRRIDESLSHDVWGTAGEVGKELRGIGKRMLAVEPRRLFLHLYGPAQDD